MKFYQEITLIDQDEISSYFIWSKLYGQLHLALAEIKRTDNTVNIGVSFPQYIYQVKQEEQKQKISLGKKLRIFAASEHELERLNIAQWLNRLTDYVHLTSIRNVPEKVNGYAIYKRRQFKTSATRLARHRVKRGDIGFEEALARYSHVVKTTDLPYIQLKSLSTSNESDQKHFKLFVERQLTAQSDSQTFSCYGLSAVSSVPEF